MATSSRATFSLEKLQEQALVSLDARIATAQHLVDSFDDDEVFYQRVEEWRAKQEERLRGLVAQMDKDEIDDYRLSAFALDPIPRQDDRYERRNAESRLRRLHDERTEVSAKVFSLTPDADGNISLTKTQLREFFAL